MFPNARAPTYNSSWVDITDKCGQYFNVTHDLNTTEVFVDITGKQTLGGGEHQRNLGGTGYTPGWSRTYGGTSNDVAYSLVQTSDGGYALAGYTRSFGAGIYYDFYLVKTDAMGNRQWNRTYGGADYDYAYSLVQTFDGGYAIAGYMSSSLSAKNFWLVKTDVEMGLARTGLTNSTITLYRGRTDPYWNYVRVRIWTVEEPTWMFGDINQDGVVDAKDLAIIGQNYGKTFSALSLGGIAAVAGIYAYKKRKRPK